MRLGNLKSKRDRGSAGDYVEAMHLMLQQDKGDDYVVGTGENHSVEEFVRLAFAHVGIKNWQDYVITDPRFIRPAEVPDLKANPAKAKKILGWEPKTSFADLVSQMVEADLKRLKNK